VVGAVLTGRSTGSGFDLAWFSSLFSKWLYIFALHGAVLNFLSHSLPFSELNLVEFIN